MNKKENPGGLFDWKQTRKDVVLLVPTRKVQISSTPYRLGTLQQDHRVHCPFQLRAAKGCTLFHTLYFETARAVSFR